MSAISLSFYRENYDLVRHYILTGSKRIFLGRRQMPCRFCGKASPLVSFRNKAHALPESFGNKTLFTRYECDSCNDLFGETIENDFGNYFKPYRAFARIRGKKSVLTIKSEARGWRIDADADGLSIHHRANDMLMERDLERKRLTSKIPRDPYTPVGVFKCFVKMAIAIMPECEVPLFFEAIEWIRTRDCRIMPLSQAILYETFADGVFPFSPMTAFVLKRKSDTTELPYLMFVVAHANSWFQIVVPCPQKDTHIYGKEIAFQLLPPVLPRGNRTAMREIDLSGTAPVAEVAAFEMRFDSFTVNVTPP